MSNKVIDLSYLKNEWVNIKNIPRRLDEEFLYLLGVSNDIISYWKEIDFLPSYSFMYTLLESSGTFKYDDYIYHCLRMIPYIKDENEKIGSALEDYISKYIESIEWFKDPGDGYTYALLFRYEEGYDEEYIFISSDYSSIIDRMNNEIKEYEKDEGVFLVELYTYSMNKSILSIDFNDFEGALIFNKNGELKTDFNIKKFYKRYDNSEYLTDPYILVPLPFKKKDFVKWVYDEKYVYGMVYALPTIEDDRKFLLDGSDLVINVQIPVLEDDGEIYMDHDHIWPYQLNYAKLTEEDEEYKLLMYAKEKMEEYGRPYWPQYEED